MRLLSLLVALLPAGLPAQCTASGLRSGNTDEAARQADQTARRYVVALNDADSAELAQLSASGSAQNSLCARRHWPATFWSHEGKAPIPRRAGYEGDDLRYRVIGDLLSGDTARAVYDFRISPKHPDKVISVFADQRLGVWTDEMRACLRR